MSTIRLWAVHPTLRATDIPKLAMWYRDFLGFQIRMLYGDPVTHAVLRRDEVRLGIAPRDANFGPVSAYIMLDRVDLLYAELLARNLTPNRPPEVTDYRMKDFDLTDPEGNRLCFGEPIEQE